jgi:RHS repeat-associated protein
MRQLSRLLTLLFLFVHLYSKAQTDVQHDKRVDLVLKQVGAKLPGLKIFGRKDGKGGFVNMAVLEESTRRLKWFTCHGVAFDSVQLKDNEYSQIFAGTSDPFTFYRNYCYENLFYIERAEIQYRLLGKEALQDTSYNSRAVFNAAPVKSAQSTLQKLIAIEELMRKISFQLRLFDSRAPGQLVKYRNDSTSIRQKLAGVMIRKNDNTEYYNTNPLATTARIVLRQKSPNRLFVFNREGALVDSVPLKPGKYASLLREKEDVFLLYRGWLELQWQQVTDSKQQYAGWLRKLDSSLYRSVSWEQSKLQLQNIAVSLREQQNLIDDRISSLVVPEEKYVEQLVADVYKDEVSEISYLPGLGFAYTISHIRGQKAYELTDHRGNVMAVVSDKKKGVAGNTDGIVEYYNADIVNSSDYYPFGALMPGRVHNTGNSYRYGYNGKENDNEVKGEGNQQDYGTRIYDPRIGRFLSVDLIASKYPELTPYQFASNRPIDGVDLDGMEFSEFAYPQMKTAERRAGMTWQQRKKDVELERKIGIGVSALPFIIWSGGSALTAINSGAVANLALWATTPTNQLAIATGAGFVFSVLNPDPGTNVDFPGYGDELGRTLNLALRTRAGKVVHFLAEKGSKFANQSEWKWAQRLLDEGNNIILWKDVQQTSTTSVRNSDLFVNGLETEIKELSKMTEGPNFLRNLVNKFDDAADQAKSVIIDGTKQKGFTEKVAKEALEDVRRKIKGNTTFRIVGEGFDFTETVTPKK